MDQLQRALFADERVLWSGVPARGLRLRDSDLVMIPFSIVWAGFMFFWQGAMAVMGAWLMNLCGIPFVLIGIHMLVGRFFADARRRARTIYAVTDQRVLILEGGNVTSLLRHKLSEIHSESHRDGRRTLTFGPTSTPKGQPASPELEFIEEGQRVLALLQPALLPYR